MVHIKKKRTACGYLEDPSLRSSGLGKGSYFRNEEIEAYRKEQTSPGQLVVDRHRAWKPALAPTHAAHRDSSASVSGDTAAS